MGNTENKKVIVFGIDAATFSLMLPWIRQNRLPNFRKLLRESSYSGLISTIPPVTIPSWPSIFSGVKHDVIGANGFTVREPMSHESRIFSSLLWKDKSIFKILNENNKKIIAVNVPGTFPVWPVEYAMVSGMPCAGPNLSYPEGLTDESYLIEESRPEMARKAFIGRIGLIENLIGQYPDFDLLAFVIRYPDSISHKSVKDWENHFFPSYKAIDDWLESIMERFKDDYLLIVSDHGTQRTDRTFYINIWLKNRGWLKYAEEPLKNKLKRDFFGYGKAILDLFEMERTKRFLSSKFGSGENDECKECGDAESGETSKDDYEPKIRIDYRKTKAFAKITASTDFNGIWINSGKNFDNGIVKDDEYEEFRDNMIEKLKKKKFVEKIWKREEIYTRNIDQFPDIIIKFAPGVSSLVDEFPLECIKSYTVVHDSIGIFIARGDGIKKNCRLKKEIRTWDIAPTIYHLMGVPAPDFVEGKVIKEMFGKKKQ